MQTKYELRSKRRTYIWTLGSTGKAVSDTGLNLWVPRLFAYQPRAVVGLIWSLYKPPKCWSEINRLPAISPAKMDLFRISRELQFWVYNYGEPLQIPAQDGRENAFIEGKREPWGLQ